MSKEKSDESVCWYAIHTKPKQELRAESNLRAWEIETFMPKIKDRRRGHGFRGSPYVIKPLFPRYVFARFDIKIYLNRVIFTRGVHSIVRFGENPAPVDDQIVSIIQTRVSEDGFIRLSDELKFGDKVVIQDGAFRNLIGIFEGKVGEMERIRILLTAITYQAHITIEKDRVRRISSVYSQADGASLARASGVGRP